MSTMMPGTELDKPSANREAYLAIVYSRFRGGKSTIHRPPPTCLEFNSIGLCQLMNSQNDMMLGIDTFDRIDLPSVHSFVLT